LKRTTIRTRILLAAILPAITAVVLLSIYFMLEQLKSLDKSLMQRGQAITNQIANAAEYGIFSGNKLILEKLVESVLSEPDVLAVSIKDSDGHIVASGGPASEQKSGGGQGVTFEQTIVSRSIGISDFEQSSPQYGPILLGTASLTLSNHSTHLAKQQLLSSGIIISLIALLIGTILALRTSRSVSLPLMRLNKAVSDIDRGKLSTRVATNSSGELGELEQGFNIMASSLENTQKELQRQVEAATRELRHTLEAVEIKNVELDLARKRALQASREKSVFLANMSHEIRTPMNGLLGFIDLLLRTPLNSEQREYTTTIRKSTANLLVIVNDILDFSKIESGTLSIEIQPFDLREALEDSVDLMAPLAHDKGLELVLFIYSDVPLLLSGDSNRIRQILLNLIGNAIKFTEQGSIIIRAMLDETDPASPAIAPLRICVTDTGNGLSVEQQSRLFKPFSQLDSSPARQYGGTGLGLYISKRLVEAMNGIIGVESEPGEGATFWFALNCGIQTSQPLHENLQRLSKPIDVVLFEPHPVARLSLRHPLEDWNFKIHEVENKEELLCSLQADSSALVIVSLSAANDKIDSESSLIQEIAAYNIPIIALVNEVEYDRLITWLQLGACVSLTKPVRREALHNALWKALQLPDADSQPFVDRRKTPRPVMPKLTGSRALLVDDNEINRKLTTLQLENLGINVDQAVTGQAAIELACSQRYDLILMDLHMPGMSGLEATAKIRKQSTLNRETPVIAITADVFFGESETLKVDGIDDCLIKPVTEYKLWETIKYWLGPNNLADNPDGGNPAKFHTDQESLIDELRGMLFRDLPHQLKQIQSAY